MDDQPTPENPLKDFNKLDLSALQNFSFGTQWTPATAGSGGGGDRDRGGERRDRRDGPGGGAPDRRDRRPAQRPSGFAGGPGAGPGAGAPSAGAGAGGERRDFSGDRGPRRDFQGGGGGGGGEGRFDRGARFGGRRDEEPEQRGPYESPFFAVTFYPEDTSFNALAKTIRSSCRTIELFEIAKTVIAKPDRFVAVLARRAGDSAAPAAGAAAAKSEPIYLSVPDGMPFESDAAAVAHVLTQHMDKFFDRADVEVDAPKGNYQVINKCSVTGELLGPPNYHRYNQIVAQHHAAKIRGMSLEQYRGRIETVRDPEVVAQWLEKMKKTTRYTWKTGAAKPPAPAAEAALDASAVASVEADQEVQAAEAVLASESPAPVAEAPAPDSVVEAVPALTFDSFDDARLHLLTTAREKIVRTVETARFHGKLYEAMPAGEIRRAIEGALQRQQRFPLDTANALRGRLRREHFTIFKKGSKGVSFVCAVKRKFRTPGQVFSESIGALIAFIEANPMIRASALPHKFLGFAPAPAAPKPAADAAPATDAPAPATAPAVDLSLVDRAKIGRMQGDLRWLVGEGYVTEFIDGRLFAAPAVVEARKKEIENEEHDPENFPDIPVSQAPFEARAPVAVETPAESAVVTAPAEPEAPAPDVPAPAAAVPAPEAPAAPAAELESKPGS